MKKIIGIILIIAVIVINFFILFFGSNIEKIKNIGFKAKQQNRMTSNASKYVETDLTPIKEQQKSVKKAENQKEAKEAKRKKSREKERRNQKEIETLAIEEESIANKMQKNQAAEKNISDSVQNKNIQISSKEKNSQDSETHNDSVVKNVLIREISDCQIEIALSDKVADNFNLDDAVKNANGLIWNKTIMDWTGRMLPADRINDYFIEGKLLVFFQQNGNGSGYVFPRSFINNMMQHINRQIKKNEKPIRTITYLTREGNIDSTYVYTIKKW